MESRGFRGFLFIALLAAGLAAGAAGRSSVEEAEGRWVAGDHHTHTLMSDGGRTLEEVASHAFLYGLDWFATTDHGGSSRRYPPIQDVLHGFEWNVPGHEHASVAIVTDEPDAVSDFEYMCDAHVRDTSRDQDLPKWNRTHADALACAAFLEGSYGGAGFFLPNHPSRHLKYGIADLRDLNDAAPTVMFGFEGIPGHQKESVRGSYYYVSPYRFNNDRSRTHGGADYMAAKVGGAWDALLGEGRRFFVFANSDFHDDECDFWPGEYAKSRTFVKGTGMKAVVDGMRSGNSFAVTGDLIDALSFTASAGGGVATMGETLRAARGDRLEISVTFRSPDINNNGDAPRVDHIDLIAGQVYGKAKPGTCAYKSDVNQTARVAARIAAGDWTCENSSCRAKIDAGTVDGPMYFRLRGTNLPPSTPGETDEEGNPLSDDEACGKDQDPPKCNTREKAYADLWFYSNPIFVDILGREDLTREDFRR